MPDTRISLILRLPRSADSEAWTEFIAIYEPLIRRFARKRGLQDADAQELVQRVFTSVASAVERWEPDRARGKFRAWLFRIARNHLINLCTSRKRERPQGGTSQVVALHHQVDPRLSEQSDVTLEYQRAVFFSAVQEVRKSVKEATWEAFWQTAVVGRDNEAVAAELGISVGAVYIAKSRVLARLRNWVTELEAEENALHG